LLIRGGTSVFGQAATNLAVNTGGTRYADVRYWPKTDKLAARRNVRFWS
jgi:hypothetical protein